MDCQGVHLWFFESIFIECQKHHVLDFFQSIRHRNQYVIFSFQTINKNGPLHWWHCLFSAHAHFPNVWWFCDWRTFGTGWCNLRLRMHVKLPKKGCSGRKIQCVDYKFKELVESKAAYFSVRFHFRDKIKVYIKISLC